MSDRDMVSHRQTAEVEDVEFLMASGESLERACARVGVSVVAMTGRLERAAAAARRAEGVRA